MINYQLDTNKIKVYTSFVRIVQLPKIKLYIFLSPVT